MSRVPEANLLSLAFSHTWNIQSDNSSIPRTRRHLLTRHHMFYRYHDPLSGPSSIPYWAHPSTTTTLPVSYLDRVSFAPNEAFAPFLVGVPMSAGMVHHHLSIDMNKGCVIGPGLENVMRLCCNARI